MVDEQCDGDAEHACDADDAEQRAIAVGGEGEQRRRYSDEDVELNGEVAEELEQPLPEASIRGREANLDIDDVKHELDANRESCN